MSSFQEELAKYAESHQLDANDLAHLDRWKRYIGKSKRGNEAWDELFRPDFIIERAFQARKDANASQADPTFLKRRSQDQRNEAMKMAQYAEAIAGYYRKRAASDPLFWLDFLLEEKDEPLAGLDEERLIQLHEREAVLFRKTAPRIDNTTVSRQRRGKSDRRSREKKAFLAAMERWLRVTYGHYTEEDGYVEGKLSANDDDLLAAMANIALNRDDITRDDVEVSRKATTKAGRRRKVKPMSR
jgi:hypothetical protein